MVDDESFLEEFSLSFERFRVFRLDLLVFELFYNLSLSTLCFDMSFLVDFERNLTAEFFFLHIEQTLLV